MTHVVRAYGPLKRQHGCDPGDADCMGPIGEYWTFMDVEVTFLWLHAALGLVIALAPTLALGWAVRRSRRRVAATLAGGVLLFVASFLAVVAWIGSPFVY